MKRIIAMVLAVPLLTGCTTMERLDSLKSSAEKLMEDSLESAALATEPADGSLLTREEAEKIAMETAGVNLGQISRLRTEYDVENGRPVYEVEFRQGNRKHELTVDASTGQVLKWDMEVT